MSCRIHFPIGFRLVRRVPRHTIRGQTDTTIRINDTRGGTSTDELEPDAHDPPAESHDPCHLLEG